MKGAFVAELGSRFLIGGLVVSAFAMLGVMLKPKSFAGLFGAAPSVAIATLGLTSSHNGKIYAATEARSMIAGAIAFFAYTVFVWWVMSHRRYGALGVTTSGIFVWIGVAFALWRLFLR
jgi:uncharacterized membrane protein (GlpM family)